MEKNFKNKTMTKSHSAESVADKLIGLKRLRELANTTKLVKEKYKKEINQLKTEEKKVLKEKEEEFELSKTGKRYLNIIKILNQEENNKNKIQKIYQPSHTFLNQMSIFQFFIKLKSLIFKVKQQWKPYSIKRAYKALNRNSIALYMIDVDEPLIRLKKDLILSLLNYKYYQNKFEDTISNLDILDVNEFEPISIKYNKTRYYVDKNKLIRFLTSETLLTGYVEVFKKLKITTITEEAIEEKIKLVMSKINLYYCPLPEDISGLTIYSGDIFIKQRYINDLKSKCKIQSLASILLTIFHEVTHLLIRSFNNNTNYFNKTPPIILNKHTFNDSGKILEHFISNNLNILYPRESLFLISLKNYSQKFHDFKIQLVNEYLQNTEEDLNYGFYLTKKGINNGYAKGECLWALSRANNQ